MHYISIRCNVLNYTRTCWRALKKDEKIPEEPEDDSKLRKNVSFMVTITESIPQLLMSCLVLRSFGISVDFFTRMCQLFSFSTSSISPCFAFGGVSKAFLIALNSSSYNWEILCFHIFLRDNFCYLKRQNSIQNLESCFLWHFVGWCQFCLLFLTSLPSTWLPFQEYPLDS